MARSYYEPVGDLTGDDMQKIDTISAMEVPMDHYISFPRDQGLSPKLPILRFGLLCGYDHDAWAFRG